MTISGKLTRRAVLKALGVSPAAGHVLAQQMQTMAMSGAGLVSGGIGGGDQAAPASEAPVQTFTSVADWWAKTGEEEARDSSRQVSTLDADIASMHQPLQTKIHLQRGRNFKRYKKRRWRDMARTLARHGIIKWWG